MHQNHLETRSITVAVLTYNSEETIDQCLSAIAQLDYPGGNVNLLVLDNGSTDRTLEILTERKVRYYEYPEFNLGQLRNMALTRAENEIVAFVDSDCIVEPDWLTEIVKWFDQPSIAIVGNEYLLPQDGSRFEKNWYPKSNFGIKENDLIPAGNMALKKDIIRTLGGFDESLITGEDAQILQLVRASGYRTISDHRIRSTHLGNAKTLREYFHKEVWYGLGMLGTVSSGSIDKPFWVSHLYFFLIIGVLLSVVAYLLRPGAIALMILLASAAGVFGVPFLAALERIYIKKRNGNLFYVSLGFGVFFLARIFALAYIYGLKRYDRN